MFGKAALFKTKSGAYWEAEPQLDGRAINVGIETSNGEEPTSAQVQFYQDVTRDLAAAFARAAPALVPRYQEWVGQPLPSDWRSAFKFVGLSIPLNGDDKNPWDISFDCLTDRRGHMFTCYFENGNPVEVSVDG